MEKEELSRLAAIIGDDAVKKLSECHVAVFGVGGVGGYICEALVRCGVGHLTVFDNDVVSRSNLNRQIIALHSTLGQRKVDVIGKRLLDINPSLDFCAQGVFYSAENADDYDLSAFDYIADAIDSVPSKLELIRRAKQGGIPIISSMGTGNKLDPSKLELADISKTEYCPLARVIRTGLRKIGINHLDVVFSREVPTKAENTEETRVPGSTAFVPAAAGLLIASKIVREITNK